MIIVYQDSQIRWISEHADVEAYTANLLSQGLRYLVIDTEIDGADIAASYYIVDGSLSIRPIASISSTEIKADGIDSATITGIPEGAHVRIDGYIYEISGGSLEFTTDHPGTYRISIDTWPLLPFEAEVKAL
ncbi:hypothetical protein [Brucella anthropi]|uniref:hypothetical protein n=1 Tax=Brucella anthropi TaxID=529 RepID=UPI0005BDC0AB|nr:hypothetical protein [Brucella anthropi]KIU69110.1 hypothetical protein TR92_07485 [Brucella anthropi]